MKKHLPWLATGLPGFAGLFFLLLTNLSFLGLALLGIAGVMGCDFLLRKRKLLRLRRAFALLLAVAFLLILIPGIGVLNSAGGRNDMENEYVLVLGCAVWKNGPSPTLRSRINTACTYLQEHPDAICIVSGGKGHDEIMSEAACMAKELISLGIPEDCIWLEDRATSTVENLKFSMDLIAEKTGIRPQNITIISSETHLYRASLMAKDLELNAITIPASTHPFLLKLNNSLREILAVWKYLIMGG